MRKFRNRGNKGFTLIERLLPVLIALALIAIPVYIAIACYLSSMRDASEPELQKQEQTLDNPAEPGEVSYNRPCLLKDRAQCVDHGLATTSNQNPTLCGVWC